MKKSEVNPKLENNSNRLFASLLDIFVFFIISILLSLFLNKFVFVPIYKNNGHLNNDYINEVSTYIINEEINSSLYRLDPNYKSGVDKKVSDFIYLYDDSLSSSVDYQFYLDSVYRYYTDYLTTMPSFGGASFNNSATLTNNFINNIYSTYWFNVFILGLDDVNSLYSEELLNNRDSFILENGHLLFEYSSNVNNLAKVNSSCYDVNLNLREDSKASLLSYFYDKSNKKVKYEYVIDDKEISFTSSSSIYQNALYDFIYGHDGYIYKLFKNYELEIRFVNFSKLYPLLISSFSSYLLIFVISPIFLKKGRTIGKLCLRSYLVNKNDESDVKWYNSLYRNIPMFILLTILFHLGMNIELGLNPIRFLGIIILIVVVSYISTIFTPSKLSIQDICGQTLVYHKEKENK